MAQRCERTTASSVDLRGERVEVCCDAAAVFVRILDELETTWWNGKRTAKPRPGRPVDAIIDDLKQLPAADGAATRGSGSWQRASAVDVERRLLRLLDEGLPDDERRRSVRVPCDLAVIVHAAGHTSPARALDLGLGGAFVAGAPDTLVVGSSVTVEVEAASSPIGQALAVPGYVAWRAERGASRRPAGIGISFSRGHERLETQLRPLLLDVLRRRLER